MLRMDPIGFWGPLVHETHPPQPTATLESGKWKETLSHTRTHSDLLYCKAQKFSDISGIFHICKAQWHFWQKVGFLNLSEYPTPSWIARKSMIEDQHRYTLYRFRFSQNRWLRINTLIPYSDAWRSDAKIRTHHGFWQTSFDKMTEEILLDVP